MSETLPKSRVIRRRDEIDRLYKFGKRVTGPSVILSYSSSSTHDFRIAITCGRAVGNAVARNRSKRRIREIIRRQPQRWQGFDVLVIVRKRVADRSFGELREELISLSGEMHR